MRRCLAIFACAVACSRGAGVASGSASTSGSASGSAPASGSASASASASASGSASASASPSASLRGAASAPAPFDDATVRRAVVAELAKKTPRLFSVNAPGVRTRLDTNENVVALTLDACGGPGGDGYDADMIALLRREGVPATIFMTARWIDAHEALTRELASDPLFEIEDHGTLHRPCSVNGASAFGIAGTRSTTEAAAEIADGAKRIRDVTGRTPRYFRSGTAHYDEVCAELATRLGLPPLGFTVNGDGGAGFSRRQVANALLGAGPGAIILVHVNRPESSGAEGMADAIPAMKKKGVRFVKVSEVGAR